MTLRARRLTESSDKQSWTNIYTTKVTSNECLSKVQSLFSCRSNTNVARSFRGNDAQVFAGFLDRVNYVPRASTT